MKVKVDDVALDEKRIERSNGGIKRLSRTSGLDEKRIERLSMINQSALHGITNSMKRGLKGSQVVSIRARLPVSPLDEKRIESIPEGLNRSSWVSTPSMKRGLKVAILITILVIEWFTSMKRGLKASYLLSRTQI